MARRGSKKLSCPGSPSPAFPYDGSWIRSAVLHDQVTGLCGWVLDAGTDLIRDTLVQKQQFAGWYSVPALIAVLFFFFFSSWLPPFGGPAKLCPSLSSVPGCSHETRRSRSNAPHDFHAISSCDGKRRGHLIQCRSAGLDCDRFAPPSVDSHPSLSSPKGHRRLAGSPSSRKYERNAGARSNLRRSAG